MDNQDTANKQLRETLFSLDDLKLIDEINTHRQRDGVKGFMILLRDLYEGRENIEVRSAIEKFFNDLNDQTFTDEVITAIDTSDNDLCKQMIISSCWQSGLDYSAYIQKFVEYSIDLNYLIALECYSVIEEWVEHCKKDDRDRWATMIEASLSDQDEQKRALLNAIISIL